MILPREKPVAFADASSTSRGSLLRCYVERKKQACTLWSISCSEVGAENDHVDYMLILRSDRNRGNGYVQSSRLSHQSPRPSPHPRHLPSSSSRGGTSRPGFSASQLLMNSKILSSRPALAKMTSPKPLPLMEE